MTIIIIIIIIIVVVIIKLVIFAFIVTLNWYVCLPLQQLWRRFGRGKLLYITWSVWRGRYIWRPYSASAEAGAGP